MIARGKYDRAGEDIPYGKELSPNLLKYVASGNGYAGRKSSNSEVTL